MVELIHRLINAGMNAEIAFDVAYGLIKQGNKSALERYVLELERGQRQLPND